ncbi:GNAT family N-acetyltransferase [Limosilactobacillus reuteri]|uniref:GNAT family N-acetyltransferase n=1 Tax=Limosilactobacillus reuteri TaxID=1598 RepID=UPI001E2D02FE|nr:GNAT family N-acetyltransferase [Limosilactobacillus reuteri]MCC4325593.1 GNAT family N-acetyltransferase [Limosilactobacillus reuteri]MCC4329539.1 GNAT family N-acetyltransferase [Limosilactobacillus reuteri]MCC4351260.1 GNAT family N-acetyltransferase [Limosilactobacillus reuteri]MCC4376304.1 GNAT family N-acetyltransferase [Limosilactobacillus reuteri]
MIEVRKVSTKSNDFKNIKQVYNTVFPQNELLPLSLLRMRAQAGKAEFCSIYNEEKWVGFFYTVYNKRIAYIFFLAIDPRYHGQGLGSATLGMLKKRYAGKIVTLSAERPNSQAANNEQRIRRHRFYAKNGFIKTGFYTVEKDNEKFDLLSTQPNVNPQLYQQLMDSYLTKHRRHYLPYKIIKE